MDSLRDALTQIKAWLDWLPTPAVALAVVAVALVVALALHGIAGRLLRRLLAGRRRYTVTRIRRTARVMSAL